MRMMIMSPPSRTLRVTAINCSLSHTSVKAGLSILVLTISVVFHAIGLSAQQRITPAEAAKYIGKLVIVCGNVASATYASRTRRRPTFLNLDRP
jgi:hypothetical protein